MKDRNLSETTAMPLILNSFSAPLNRPPPKLDERSQTEFINKAQQLAPKCRTELPKPSPR